MSDSSLREYEYTVVDVFTTIRLKGNPLAVFPAARGISDAEMQAIAGEFNLSETVFILPPAIANAAAKLRIFTPRAELAFAGHPTVGAAYVLSAGMNAGRSFVLEENVGPVPIEQDTDDDGNRRFWLTTPKITLGGTLDRGFGARLLNLPESDVSAGVPPQFASAGTPFFFVNVVSPDAVDRAEFQHAHLREAVGSAGSVGTFVFARQAPASSTNYDVYARMFAPQSNIAEDPATGSATGPLAAYMREYGLLPQKPITFTSEQGTKMGRRSLLRVRVEGAHDVTIKIGGSAVTVTKGRFFLDSSDSR
ncbi:MAG TPA: PhzF family phenazine biosynthesis protein [Candidatus Elarobacter sp.]|jgi:trans-2,3-dihydro-3-hydroxyanthranilate isomerase|nr:PhzF family phenazine biosynthesis protein [Candidatus Elarobacter sp.]